jgi:pre-mRNA-splicing factor ISY1
MNGAASFDTDGQEIPGADGYKYFGAAKNLPKVRELFQKEVP